MRRPAKAPSAASTTGQAGRIGSSLSLLTAIAVLIAALALGPASASAVVPRSYVCQITGSDTPSATECNTIGNTVPGGAFGSPFGVTVDPDDNVWISDNAKGLVDKFDADGSFVLQADGTGSFAGSTGVNGLGYANDADRLFVGDRELGTVWGINPDGTYAGMQLHEARLEHEFGGINVAVDNSDTATNGFIYVALRFGGAVFRFDPSGAPSSWSIGSTPERRLDGVTGVSVLPNGNVVVADSVGVTEYKPTGEFVRELIVQHNISAFAVDPTNGNFLLGVENGGEGGIREYSASGKFLAQIDGSATPAGSFFSRGLVVDSDGRLYSTDTENGVVNVFGPAPILPKIALLAVSNLTPSSATLNATVDPDGVALTECEFEWGTDTSYGETPIPCTPDPGFSSDPVAVHADLSGLDPDTTYHYRVHTTNANGDIESEDRLFGPPLVKTSPAAIVTDTSALLGGKVNPQNSATSYHLEYATSPDFAFSVSVPAGDTSAGAGNAFLDVVQKASGLSPSTRYYYRLVATNPVSTAFGLTRSFVTLTGGLPGPDLPDGRLYERVSPLEKHGADIFIGGTGTFGVSAASESGDAVAYWTRNVSFDGDGGILTAPYISRRGDTGWSTKGIAPQVDPRPAIGQFAAYRWLSPDLSKGVLVTPAAVNPGDPKGIYNTYLRETQSGSDRLLSIYEPGLVPSPKDDLNALYLTEFVGASKDASHVVFQPLHPLTADLSEGCAIYEWVDGLVRPVAVLPDGTLASDAVPGAMSRCESNNGYSGQNVVSEDGSRIYFSLERGQILVPVREGSNGSSTTGPLYVRENGTTTQHVSVYEAGGAEPSEDHVHFELARASDGAVAFFTDDQERTPDAVPGTNLYRWDANALVGNRLTDVTTADPLGAGVIDVLEANNDATSVYFRASGVLAPGGVRGQANIYLWQEGNGVRYVADGAGINLARTEGASTPVRGEIRVTPSGNQMLFESKDRLTAYDNAGFTQLYLYDAIRNETVCVSCNPRADESNADAGMFAVQLPVSLSTRNLSNGGNRVFFNSREALVPQDNNGRRDVYEWTDGRVYLISSGSSKADSSFVDASASGNDVFFLTEEQLVRSDTDKLIDVYDARVGGTPEPPVIPGCLGDECQGTPKAPPVFNNPSTSTYSGPGNQGSGRARCGKGKRAVKKEGKARCVRKRKHAHKRSNARTQRQQGRAGR